MRKVMLVTTGNEVLNGDVLDTNTNWLCKRITGLGGFVESATLVRDDVVAIAREIRAGLARGADLLITVGGLGPTEDDMTLTAVAQSTDRTLALHPDALAQVARKYAELATAGAVQDGVMTPPREKMARLPVGAEPLANTIGGAPGVLLRLPDSAVVSLPGVPAEMRGIFEGSLQPLLREIFGQGVFVEQTIIAGSSDESVLAPILATVAQRHPNAYIKSHAQRFGPDVRFRVTVSQSAATHAEAEEAVDAAVHAVEDTLNAHGIATQLATS
jgi:molybdenum cofactor synthesis domain-containing protein